MPEKLFIHPHTNQILEAYLQQPPHALLLVGSNGIGKYTIANSWASKLTNDKPQVLKPDEKGSISIDNIRDLYRTSKSRKENHQVIIIDHAESMSKEAENALLKLLEEPRERTTFILTAPKKEALLQTITSRSQIVHVNLIDNNILKDILIKSNVPEKDLNQMLFIANGRPGILFKLLNSPERFDQERQNMEEAKKLLSESQYQRMIAINKLSSDRRNCISILSAMLRMVSLQIKRADQKQLKNLVALAELLEQAIIRIQANGNIKIQLIKLFTSY